MTKLNSSRPKPLGEPISSKEFFDYAKQVGAEMLDAALSALAIDPRRRPETLAVAEVIELSNKLRKT